LAGELLEGRVEDLLRVLQRDVAVLALLAGVDTDGANNKLFLGIHLNELFLSWDFIAHRRHRPRVLVRRGSVAHVAQVAVQLARSQRAPLSRGELAVHRLVSVGRGSLHELAVGQAVDLNGGLIVDTSVEVRNSWCFDRSILERARSHLTISRCMLHKRNPLLAVGSDDDLLVGHPTGALQVRVG